LPPWVERETSRNLSLSASCKKNSPTSTRPSVTLYKEARSSWQNTKAGEREVQKALRKVIYVKYQVKDQDLFDKAFGYIRSTTEMGW